jgi:hypothetical protein
MVPHPSRQQSSVSTVRSSDLTLYTCHNTRNLELGVIVFESQVRLYWNMRCCSWPWGGSYPHFIQANTTVVPANVLLSLSATFCISLIILQSYLVSCNLWYICVMHIFIITVREDILEVPVIVINSINFILTDLYSDSIMLTKNWNKMGWKIWLVFVYK